MIGTWIRCWSIGLAALALSGAALAGQAYTTTNVNLRAGPDTDYPVLRWVPEGTVVEVHGCLEDYEWCDVETMGERGWMHANYLAYPYQQQYVPVVNYGPVLGLPIIVFSIDSYWDNHYRRRPWYGDRDRFRHRGPDYRRPPPAYRAPQPRPDHRYPGVPRPDYYPPRVHPTPRPDYRPPRIDPGPRPDYRPPAARPPGGWQPPPPQAGRPPDVGRPPAPRPPAPPPSARPPHLPHGFGAGGPPRGRDPQGLRNDAGERGGMNSGNF
ncbi:MAG: SH3 domain-containing protein [Burkholderiaceae bacterium]|nr:SH3 domain-containing protein [Burkholderiaceae bacterium]